MFVDRVSVGVPYRPVRGKQCEQCRPSEQCGYMRRLLAMCDFVRHSSGVCVIMCVRVICFVTLWIVRHVDKWHFNGVGWLLFVYVWEHKSAARNQRDSPRLRHRRMDLFRDICGVDDYINMDVNTAEWSNWAQFPMIIERMNSWKWPRSFILFKYYIHAAFDMNKYLCKSQSLIRNN